MEKKGWGHSYPEYAVKIANLARAKSLVLTHHDPTDTDECVDTKVSHTCRYIQENEIDLNCSAAQVGQVIDLS